MALSGSYNWTLNRDQVITGALRKLAVIASGQTPSAQQVTDASEALNAIVKAFQADGMPLWAIDSYTFTVTSGTATYTIGIGQTQNTVAPLKVLQALYTTTGASAVPMNVYNRYDFDVLPNLSTVTGTPISLYYQPQITATDAKGTIKLWPVPEDSTTTITLHYQRQFQDLDTASDNFDFPTYWIQALIYFLAWSLAPEYGIPPSDRELVMKEAIYWKDQALSYGSEEGGIFFQPDTQGY